MSEAPVLWNVIYSGEDRWWAHQRYQYDNSRVHRPVGEVIFQEILEGQVEIVLGDGSRHIATAGTALLFQHGEDSRYGFPADNRLHYRGRWLTMIGAGLPEHWNHLRARTGPVVPMDDALRAAHDHLRDLAKPSARCDATTIAAAIHALTMTLLSGARERQRQELSPVECAIDDLLAKPSAPWSLKRLADTHGVSREHLTRAFIQRVGSPPATWLNQARLTRALHLLQHTGLGLSQLAQESGFGSTHTMARLVREHTGLSPEHYRIRHRTTHDRRRPRL